ncbi:MAG: hypothetical protein ACJARS_004104 [bacterium]|jgi:hypothetical protein
MSDAFVLPADLGLTLTKNGFSLKHDGDVTLGQTLGKTLERVTAGGDLTLNLAKTTGIIYANGVVRITGDVDADTIYGREVHIESNSIKARAISASEKIVIGSAKLKVDILSAPDIELDDSASGRVTVIECLGDLPASRVRGGYSLEEYEEDFGDSAAFLADRGVSPLGEAAEAPEAAAQEDADDEADDDGQEHDAPDTVNSEMKDIGTINDAEHDLIPVEDEPEEEEEEDGDTLYPKLTEALERIVGSYDDGLPPSVQQLQSAIEARDYETLRGNITDIWTGLLGYHQQRGIRPHHQVTHAFNVIHGLVTEA